MRAVTALLVSMFCVGLAAPARADYTLIDNFESYLASQFLPTAPATYWSSSSVVVGDSSSKHLAISTQTRSFNNDPALNIADGTTATVFFSYKDSGSPCVVGMAASVHEGFQNATAAVVLQALYIQPFGGVPQNYVISNPGVWYKVWMVIDNQSDTVDYYLQGGTSGPFVNQTLIGNDLPFQAGAAGLPLRSFSFSHGGHLDDMYISTGDAHLGDPTSVPEPATLSVLAVTAMAMIFSRHRRHR